MAIGSMADWESIVSYGMLRVGHTPAQRSCMLISLGILDQFGDQYVAGSKGPFSLGLNLSLH